MAKLTLTKSLRQFRLIVALDGSIDRSVPAEAPYFFIERKVWMRLNKHVGIRVMETVIILLGIAAVFVVLLFIAGIDGSDDAHKHHETKPQPNRHDRPNPQPFDLKTAKPRSDLPDVQGPAFIIDGDTLVIKKNQIRLFGIDAPEMKHPYGKKAKWALVSLCKGRIVSADFIDQDDYGRFTAKCYLEDGRDLSAEMVKLGLAIDWAKFSGGKYRVLEMADARKKLWLADARQKGRMHVWKKFEATQNAGTWKD